MPANLDLVRSIFEAWGRGEFGDTSWAHPEIEFERVDVGLPSGRWHGKDQMAGAVRDWLNPWERFEMVAKSYNELDPDRVLVFAHQGGRGKRSGLETGGDLACLFEVRSGRVSRLALYSSVERARAELGAADAREPAPDTPNVALVRSIYDAWAQGDFRPSAWADPDIEFGYIGGPEPAASRGIEPMNVLWREWLRDWEGFRAEPVEYRVIDEDRILVLVRNRGRGRLSGLEFEERSVGNYFELDGGRVRKLVVYLDGARALADLGFEA